MNMVTDLAAWLRRKFGFRSTMAMSRNLRYVAVVVILIGSAVSGTLLWEWLNPVTTLGRGLINGLTQTPIQDLTLGLLFDGLAFGFGAGIWLIAAVFVLDLFVVEHGWCGHLCPIGALYGAIGSKSLLRIAAVERERCTRCMDCINVCPEAHILREPLFGKDPNRLVLSKDCTSCGRCIDVCPEKVFQIKTRFHQSGVKE
jgi:ferredoxin-type protein NapH